jgi:uncharacterized membrane protein (UPF0127 family)
MKKLLLLIIFFLVTSAVLLVVHVETPLHPQSLEMRSATIGTTTLSVMVADNPVSRAKGLSRRTTLSENEGMLFVFDSPTRPGFWMKDMNFPIDIIWINDENRIVGVEKNASPASYPQSFYPSSDVRSVLEVTAGFFDNHSLKVGDSFSLESQNLNL